MSRTYANKTTAAIGEYFQSAQLRLKRRQKHPKMCLILFVTITAYKRLKC